MERFSPLRPGHLPPWGTWCRPSDEAPVKSGLLGCSSSQPPPLLGATGGPSASGARPGVWVCLPAGRHHSPVSCPLVVLGRDLTLPAAAAEAAVLPSPCTGPGDAGPRRGDVTGHRRAGRHLPRGLGSESCKEARREGAGRVGRGAQSEKPSKELKKENKISFTQANRKATNLGSGLRAGVNLRWRHHHI